MMDEFDNRITPVIRARQSRPVKPFIFEPNVLSDNTEFGIQAAKAACEYTQRKMREGEFAQLAIGYWHGNEDLGIGHPTGLDCRALDNSWIMEIKNNYNTCNSGSRKTVDDKLAKYKKTHPETRCIYGVINPLPIPPRLHKKSVELKAMCKDRGINQSGNVEEVKLRLIENLCSDEDMLRPLVKPALTKTYMHNGVELEELRGGALFEFIFTKDGCNYTQEVWSLVRRRMNLTPI